jgi:hypothetical protein
MSTLLLYLSRHGQHVSSLDVRHYSGWKRVGLHELPPGLQLNSLCLQNMSVQLRPGSNRRGVLEALTAITHLRLVDCCLLDADCLEGPLQQLPHLQHLQIACLRRKANDKYQNRLFVVNSEALQQLQGLTYLELEHCDVNLPTPEPQLQLSNLQSLRLRAFKPSFASTASRLASVLHLTMLELQPSHKKGDPCPPLPPGIVTNKLQLQHLHLSHFNPAGDAAAVSDFLYDLEQLTELTHLSLNDTLNASALPTAAAYASLTVSSKLQQLHMPRCKLPPYAWQHVLPFGRQLPHLQVLQLSNCTAMGVFGVASLVSCCPSLQELELPFLEGGSGAVLAPLAVLVLAPLAVLVLAPLGCMTRLQKLDVPGECMCDSAVRVLARLTGLHDLSFESTGISSVTDAGMLPLTALRQLHSLRFMYAWTPPDGKPPTPVSHWWYTSVSHGSMPHITIPHNLAWCGTTWLAALLVSHWPTLCADSVGHEMHPGMRHAAVCTLMQVMPSQSAVALITLLRLAH